MSAEPMADTATLTARIGVLQECIRRLVTTYQQSQTAWQPGSPCAVESPCADMRARAQHSHPPAARSACYFCPNSGDDRWRDLKAQHPDLWAKAVHLDERIRTNAPFNVGRGVVAFDGQMYLHGSLTPLADADIRSSHQKAVDGGQGALFDEDVLAGDCEAGVCFT